MNGVDGVSLSGYSNEKDPFLTDAASVLGLSYDDLESKLESGTDLDTIVTEQGLTVDDFQ